MRFSEQLEVFKEYFKDWEVECESPLEIRHITSDSVATMDAAEIVISALVGEDFWKRF